MAVDREFVHIVWRRGGPRPLQQARPEHLGSQNAQVRLGSQFRTNEDIQHTQTYQKPCVFEGPAPQSHQKHCVFEGPNAELR